MVKLARITGLTPPELLSIGTHWGETDRTLCRLLGQRIRSADLQFQQEKVCPECVMAKGFIEAHFDLAVMIACPVHGKLLVTHCSQCSAKIRWNRPGLLICPCGATLIRSDDSSISSAVRELLDIVRRKVLHLELGEEYSSGIPVAQLWEMTLRSLVYLIGTLGRRVVGGRGVLEGNDYARTVPAAAAALANWPCGFHDWLRELTAEIPDDVPLRLNALPLRGIYLSVVHGVRPRSDAKFLRQALSAFVVSHLTVVDPPKISLTAKSSGKTYQRRVAARTLGILPSILSSLKESEHFQASHCPDESSDFHDSDVMVFAERLVSIASLKGMGRDETQRSIRLECIMQSNFWTVEEKTDIVKRLLDGYLQARGCDDGTIGGILVPVSAIGGSEIRVLRGQTQILFPKALQAADDGGHRMKANEAASYLHCSRRSILRLLEDGHIQAIKRGNTWLIEEKVLRVFGATYIQLSLVADELRTNSRALARYCEAHGVPTLSPGRGGTSVSQSFIRVKDKPKPDAFNAYFDPRTLRLRIRQWALAA
jgi:excisionase family DNA binding protein